MKNDLKVTIDDPRFHQDFDPLRVRWKEMKVWAPFFWKNGQKWRAALAVCSAIARKSWISGMIATAVAIPFAYIENAIYGLPYWEWLIPFVLNPATIVLFIVAIFVPGLFIVFGAVSKATGEKRIW